MVDSKLKVVGCSRFEGEKHGTMSQQTWVVVLAVPDLTSWVTLASQAGRGRGRNKPTYPICFLHGSNETTPGREPAHSLALRSCPAIGQSLSVSAIISVVQTGGISPLRCCYSAVLGMSRGPQTTTAHQYVALWWHVKPLGNKPVLTGGRLSTLLDFI